MTVPNKPSYSHGSQGTEPSTAKDYDNGNPLDSDHFDYFVYTPFRKIKQIIDHLNALASGSESVGEADNADTVDGQHASAFLGANDQADDADTVDGQHASAFLGTNEQATDSDKVDGQDYSDIQSWVNNNADVPNADHADNADDANTLQGKGPSDLSAFPQDGSLNITQGSGVGANWNTIFNPATAKNIYGGEFTCAGGNYPTGLRYTWGDGSTSTIDRGDTTNHIGVFAGGGAGFSTWISVSILASNNVDKIEIGYPSGGGSETAKWTIYHE